MMFHAPQMILTGLVLISMGINWARYGKQKTDSVDMSDCLIAPATLFGLLYWGGFYG